MDPSVRFIQRLSVTSHIEHFQPLRSVTAPKQCGGIRGWHRDAVVELLQRGGVSANGT